MASTVGLSCGHGMQLIDATMDPPEHAPWILWPEPDIELGDEMTCIVDSTLQTVTAIYNGLTPIRNDGKLVILP